MKYNVLITAILFALLGNLKAQEKLTFEKALALTLANNYDILMAQVNEEMATNSASRANNGFLPTVTGSGAYNWTYYEGTNELKTEDIHFDPNNSYNYSASALVNYTLFDGQGRKYTYLQAKGNLKMSELQLQQTIQNTILELSSIYHEVARLEENVAFLQQSVAVSIDRFARAESQYEYGQAKQLDILNAKVDLNSDSISLVTGIQELENLKRNLNYIMGQEISQAIVVEQTVEIRKNIVQDEVLLAAEGNNLQLKLAENNLKLSEYAIGSSRSSWMPTLAANAGYQYRGTEDPNGAFLIGSNNYGPQAGLSLSWNLFNGSTNTQVKNAKLSLKNSAIEQKSLEQNIKSQAMNSYATYRNLLFVLNAQADNVATAKDNFNRSEASFKLGQINSIEFRQAQLNLLNAEQALSKAKYDAKNAELQVLAVMGSLVE
jgi:outer membrane protein TolC